MSKDERELSRRALMLSLVPGGVAAAGLVGGATALLLPPAPRRSGRIRRVCPVADMDVGGQVILGGGDNVLIMREVNGIYAISLVCTHLGCAVTRDQRGFRCHCHGSTFTAEGRPLQGPATRPLPWFSVIINDGWVLVDLDREVAPGTVTAAV